MVAQEAEAPPLKARVRAPARPRKKRGVTARVEAVLVEVAEAELAVFPWEAPLAAGDWC